MNNIKEHMLSRLVIIFFCICVVSVADNAAQDCNYWYAAVGVKSANGQRGNKDEKDTKNILDGIECLLKLEGDKSRGAYSGATSFSGPAFMPEATVEINALYYISKLFYDNYKHTDALALRRPGFENNKILNSDEIVSIAFESYRKWFEKVKEIGLEEARKQKLDPLCGSGVRWY